MRVRPLKPCIACGGEKTPGVKGARLCADCLEKRATARKHRARCNRCRGPKGDDAPRGARLCKSCRPIAHVEARERARNAKRHPCVDCGGPKTRPIKRRCEECEAKHLEKRKAALRKPCAGCGGEKTGSRPGSSYCATCLVERERKHLCEVCGGPKGPGVGRRICEPCQADRAPRCSVCNEVKQRRRGRHYCDDCAEVMQWKAERKVNARKVRRRKSCAGCGKVKPPGRGRRYCDACAAAMTATPLCRVCEVERVPVPIAKICVECKQTQTLRRREACRLRRQRQIAADPAYLERERAKARERWTKNKGRRKRKPAKVLRFPRKTLPAKPLADYIGRIIAAEEAGSVWGYKGGGDPQSNGRTRMICERVGTTDRSLRAWRSGERETVTVDIADIVLTRTGAMWWDIWQEDDPESYAIAQLVFEGAPVKKAA